MHTSIPTHHNAHLLAGSVRRLGRPSVHAFGVLLASDVRAELAAQALPLPHMEVRTALPRGLELEGPVFQLLVSNMQSCPKRAQNGPGVHGGVNRTPVGHPLAARFCHQQISAAPAQREVRVPCA